jgi:hypothetical protein
VKHLYIENYKTLMKEFEEDTKIKDVTCHGLEELILQVSILLRVILIKIPMTFFKEIEKYPEIHMEP